jgi:hypothetical protein
VRDNGQPRIVWLGVSIDSDDPRVLPCVAAEPCTVPTYTDFQVRFTARTDNGGITGYTWQPTPDFWEPFGTPLDTFFLELADVDGDSLAFDDEGRPRWSLSADQDTVTMFLRSSRQAPLQPGSISVRARARDEARQISERDRGVRGVTVNYDPDTRLFTVRCDSCPPNPARECDGQTRVPAGWVIGIGEVDSFPREEWRLFCEGDTIPNYSNVRFYAEGRDDSRDLPKDPAAAALPEVRFRFRFEYSGEHRDGTNVLSNTNMPFSLPALPARDLPRPSAVGGGTFRGAMAPTPPIEWQTCPFEYKFEAGAVDEHDKVDGTPAAIRFVVGGTPVIDSVFVPKVIVFVPTCGSDRPTFCPGYAQTRFGPDTLAVFGIHRPDAADPSQWQTPFGLGFNEFIFPIRGWGHDHPRDRNPPEGPVYYNTEAVGRIRSWFYTFDCLDPGCTDVVLPGENLWRDERPRTGDPVNQQVFDDTLRLGMPLDTLCVIGGRCTAAASRATLNWTRFGNFAFTLKGLDTDYIGQVCVQPSDLGENQAEFPIAISEYGRTTQVERRQTVWRQLSDVRPIRKAAAAAAPAGAPFANRKRLMQ